LVRASSSSVALPHIKVVELESLLSPKRVACSEEINFLRDERDGRAFWPKQTLTSAGVKYARIRRRDQGKAWISALLALGRNVLSLDGVLITERLSQQRCY